MEGYSLTITVDKEYDAGRTLYAKTRENGLHALEMLFLENKGRLGHLMISTLTKYLVVNGLPERYGKAGQDPPKEDRTN
ncbi:MAG TPA: hypothetical protein VJL58_07380 [Pyrinomonadaceae bacterium]|nr:hypothetical protein [Pyrinomonadaceae bacterium]